MSMHVLSSSRFFHDLHFYYCIHSSCSEQQVHQLHHHVHIQCTRLLQCQVQASLPSLHKHFHAHTLSQATVNSVSIYQIHIFVNTMTQNATLKQNAFTQNRSNSQKKKQSILDKTFFHFSLPSSHKPTKECIRDSNMMDRETYSPGVTTQLVSEFGIIRSDDCLCEKG